MLFAPQIVPKEGTRELYFINSSPQECTLVGKNVAHWEGKLNSEFLSVSRELVTYESGKIIWCYGRPSLNLWFILSLSFPVARVIYMAPIS